MSGQTQTTTRERCRHRSCERSGHMHRPCPRCVHTQPCWMVTARDEPAPDEIVSAVDGQRYAHT